MKCPFCDFTDSKVIDSRPTEEGSSIRRRRECINCGKRFTTYEKVESVPVMVIKKDQTREPFDRDKVLSGIIQACRKRPVSMEQMVSMVDNIEAEVQNLMDREITSTRIGEMVMAELKQTDDVAYVRFASVYRQFKDINTFLAEVNKLLTDKN
ncbi:MAG: transcriptional repressor NrdR [Clostridia bacterium]|nr:transcriptional repressor NrdR [Clostridia bacterium]